MKSCEDCLFFTCCKQKGNSICHVYESNPDFVRTLLTKYKIRTDAEEQAYSDGTITDSECTHDWANCELNKRGLGLALYCAKTEYNSIRDLPKNIVTTFFIILGIVLHFALWINIITQCTDVPTRWTAVICMMLQIIFFVWRMLDSFSFDFPRASSLKRVFFVRHLCIAKRKAFKQQQRKSNCHDCVFQQHCDKKKKKRCYYYEDDHDRVRRFLIMNRICLKDNMLTDTENKYHLMTITPKTKHSLSDKDLKQAFIMWENEQDEYWSRGKYIFIALGCFALLLFCQFVFFYLLAKGIAFSTSMWDDIAGIIMMTTMPFCIRLVLDRAH